MPEPTADFVEISSAGGVVTAKITASSVEERPANVILARRTQMANRPLASVGSRHPSQCHASAVLGGRAPGAVE